MKCWIGLALCLLIESAAAAPAARAATTVWRDPVAGMPFVSIPKGCFQMGADAPVAPLPDWFWEVAGYQGNISDDEGPRHEVCLRAFWIGQYEVRIGEWRQVMGSEAGSDVRADGAPVTGVSWEQANEFAARLTERAGGKLRFRLPTEAEWEYACRAGAAKEIIPVHEELVGKAWYGTARAYSPEPHVAGLLPANGFGLHDMLGNAWEWTEDSYLPNGYVRHALYQPKVLAASKQRVIRGGGFRTEAVQMRCAMRGHYHAGEQLDSIGFRLVRDQ